MKKILIGYPLAKYEFFEDILRILSTKYKLVMKDYHYGWLKANIHEFDIIVPNLGTVIDDKVIKSAKNLKLIFTPTTGQDHIRIKNRNKHIKVLTLNDYKEEIYSINSTAELGFSLLSSLARKTLLAHNDVVKYGRWERNDFLGNELNNKTIGIVGMGRIGQKIAGYAKAFGMKVIYWDQAKCDKWKRIKNLKNLLSQSDFIIVSISLNAKTHYLINRNSINQIKKGAVLVNISRGKVIEEEALCYAVDKDILRGVGTDVLEFELDDCKKSPLYRFARGNPKANIIITPHIGGATIDAWQKVFSLVFKEIVNSSII
jgi:phosphoglycerate dehydrogenase-like enzyme